MSSESLKTNQRATDGPHRSGYVALIGPANAGKSTLLNAILGKKVSIVSAKQQTTRNRILGIDTKHGAQVVYLDTPGFLTRRYRGELSRFISDALSESAKEADLNLLVLDASKSLTDRNIAKRLSSAIEKRAISAPGVIAINKVDLLDRKLLLPMLKELSDVFQEHSKGLPVDIVPISALKQDGIEILKETILKRLPEGPAFFPSDVVSDQPEQFFVAEVVREKLFERLHKEIPYSCAVTVSSWEEGPDLLKIEAVIFVERDSQKGVVIGKRGETLKAIGMAARLELERLLRTRIYLNLFVRVEANWTRTERGMSKAGYLSDAPYGIK